MNVFGILNPFANFAVGEVAPNKRRMLSKKGLSGVQGWHPCVIQGFVCHIV